MKDVYLRIRVEENQFEAEIELIKFLVWDGLCNYKSKFEEAFTVNEVIVDKIEPVDSETLPF